MHRHSAKIELRLKYEPHGLLIMVQINITSSKLSSILLELKTLQIDVKGEPNTHKTTSEKFFSPYFSK
jgi:hypothetical protein